MGRTSRFKAVLLDVGFTLTGYDPYTLAGWAGDVGIKVGPEALLAAEAPLRRGLGTSTFAFDTQEVGQDDDAPLGGGERFYFDMLCLGLSGKHRPAHAGAFDERLVRRAARHIWKEHLKENVFSRVLPGVPEALDRLEGAGVRMVVVSNSEGTVEAMLRKVGLRPYFREVLDSEVEGVRKPARDIFEMALAAAGSLPRETLMVGDSWPADVLGAHALGIESALVDPFGVFPVSGFSAPDVPRFPSLLACVNACVLND